MVELRSVSLMPDRTHSARRCAAARRLPFAFAPRARVLEYDLDALGAKAGRMTMVGEAEAEGHRSCPSRWPIETNTFFLEGAAREGQLA